MLWECMFTNFHLKYFTMLECYLLRKLVLEKFILLEDFGLITFYYILEDFLSLEDFNFTKLV